VRNQGNNGVEQGGIVTQERGPSSVVVGDFIVQRRRGSQGDKRQRGNSNSSGKTGAASDNRFAALAADSAGVGDSSEGGAGNDGMDIVRGGGGTTEGGATEAGATKDGDDEAEEIIDTSEEVSSEVAVDGAEHQQVGYEVPDENTVMDDAKHKLYVIKLKKKIQSWVHLLLNKATTTAITVMHKLLKWICHSFGKAFSTSSRTII
jgi:hypothetical protein